jgi:IS30 family transposase
MKIPKCQAGQSPLEWEEIRSILIGPDRGFTLIAIVLGRDASTISRQVGRSRWRERYRATGAQPRSDHERKPPRQNLLIADPLLACLARADLDQGFGKADHSRLSTSHGCDSRQCMCLIAHQRRKGVVCVEIR